MPLLGAPDVGVEVIEPERHLIRVEPLGPTPELRALQLLDDQPELLDLAVAPLHVADEVAHQLLQQARIIGQGVEIEAHAQYLTMRRRFDESIAVVMTRDSRGCGGADSVSPRARDASAAPACAS
jgi:hypothetical protein